MKSISVILTSAVSGSVSIDFFKVLVTVFPSISNHLNNESRSTDKLMKTFLLPLLFFIPLWALDSTGLSDEREWKRFNSGTKENTIDNRRLPTNLLKQID